MRCNEVKSVMELTYLSNMIGTWMKMSGCFD